MSPEPFSVRSERAGRVHRVTPAGDLEIASAPVLERAFDTVDAADPSIVIVVDLGTLTFMDSTGLICWSAWPTGSRGNCGSSTALRRWERLFEVSGMRGRLPIIAVDADPLTPPPGGP